MRHPLRLKGEKRAAVVAVALVAVLVAVSCLVYVRQARKRHARLAWPGKLSSPDVGEETDEHDIVPPGADIVLERTKITVPGHDGDPGWDFSAERIELGVGNKSVKLMQVEGARLVDGRPEVEARAGSLTADLESGRVDFEGFVQVKTRSGALFEAARASWDAERKSFSASGGVKYRAGKGKASIFGDSLEADVELESVSLRGNVKLSVQVARR